MSADVEAVQSSKAVEAIRQTTIRVLSERIRLLGVNRSGAYEHYSLLLSQGFPIPSYEVMILELVRSHLPNLKSYHEIGSGLGTLPLMLAHDGFVSVGVERDERRHLTATTILRELSTELPHVENNCRFIGAAFPDAVADLDVSESMAILTDVVSSQNQHDYPKLCRGLARYRYVLMDLQRFWTKREARAEQEKLVGELAAYGLVPCREMIDLGTEGSYLLFECKAPVTHTEESEGAGTPAKQLEVGQRELAAEMPGRGFPLVSASRGDVALIDEAGRTALLAQTASLPSTVGLPPRPQRQRRRRFGGLLVLSALLVIGVPSLLAILYYGFWASNQYVTTFQFAVRGPAAAAAPRTSSTSMGVSAMSPDAFVVTDYINSPQAIGDVSRDVDLRAIFSKPGVDFWSRLPTNVTPEELNAYWGGMVSAYFDLISGNISVSVRAFTPQDSLNLSRALIAASDQMFRRLNLQAQRDFLQLADETVKRAEQQLAGAQRALLEFREKSGLVEPDKTAVAGSAIIDELRRQLAGFQAQYATIQSVSPKSPNLEPLRMQMNALEGQIKGHEQLGSSAVRAVTAATLGRYQSLEVDRQSAEKQYAEALGVRSQVYLAAQNQLSYLALFVEPTLPQTSRYPERLRAIISVVLAAAAAWFVGMLITYAVRDHLV